MFNGGTPITCGKLRLVALLLTIAAIDVTLADALPIDEEQTQVIMEKTEEMEAKIQRRQQELAVRPEESKGYQTGFEDGYNKAILDLLKSKLLNDPSLSPKPKGAGLQATTTAYSTRRSAQQYHDDMSSNAAALTSPALPAEVPAASLVPLAPIASSANSIASVEPVTASTTIVISTAAAVVSPQIDQTKPQQQEITAQDWIQKGNAYLGERNWQQAIDAATQAIALNSNFVDSYIVRSWAYAESGQNQQALEDIAAAIRLDPENALAYNNRAYVHELLNNTDNAQQDYQQACSLGYQQACETVGKLKQAVEQQRQATINELTDKSYQQFQQQDWQSVVKTATELLMLDPENTVALVNRAGAYTELGNYKNALDDCNTALIIDPNMGIAYNNKGYVLELMGELKKAAMEYETACVLGVQQSCSDYKRLSQQVSALN